MSNGCRTFNKSKYKKRAHKLLKQAQKCNDVDAIGPPQHFEHSTHVNFTYQWKGLAPHERFSIEELLGTGSFGRVFKLVDATTAETPMAAKVMDSEHPLAGSLVKEIVNEMDILKNCRSPHVTSYYGFFRTIDSFWILMEYCDLGSLKDLLEVVPKELSENQCAYLLANCVRGLQYLHDVCGIIHRDIKPANILMTYTVDVKIADFGFASTEVQLSGAAGSLFYMAPEVLTHHQVYSYKADIWSLGVVAIEVAEKEVPHFDVRSIEAISIIRDGPPPYLGINGKRRKVQTSDHFHRFVYQCLQKDPTARLSAALLLEDSFIKNAPTDRNVLKKRLIKYRNAVARNTAQQLKKGTLNDNVSPVQLLTNAQKELIASARIPKGVRHISPRKSVDCTTNDSLSEYSSLLQKKEVTNCKPCVII